MKILIVSTFEQAGGAARSAFNLYRKLICLGTSCKMLVQYRCSNDEQVIAPTGWLSTLAGWIRPYLDAFPILLYRSRLSPPWSLAWLPNKISPRITAYSPDIIHLHGVGHGFLSLKNIASLNKPLIWTLHDSWAFTGGCHLPGECERYQTDCGYCPQLNGRHEHDLSRWCWNRKNKYWSDIDVVFVAPSRWLAECARSSSLLNSKQIEVVPNGIDTLRFTPGDRASARAALGLSQHGLILLYGASQFTRDANKGFALLEKSLTQIAASMRQVNLTIVLFGDRSYHNADISGVPVRSFGAITDEEELVFLYQAADFFVLPSLQENLPYTVMESMACGTPCVAFNVGGVRDLIDHEQNGVFAMAVNEFDLADGITWMLADSDRRALMGIEARKTIESRFSIVNSADSYLKLYASALEK